MAILNSNHRRLQADPVRKGARLLPARIARSRGGFTILELSIALAIFAVILIAVGNLFLSFSRGFTYLTKRAHLSARAQVVMDRMVEELIPGSFITLEPPNPNMSAWVRFQKVTGIVGNSPVLGDPVQIDLIPQESSIADGIDNDGDGVVDEGGIRIWYDSAPWGGAIGPEDQVTVITANVAKDGLKFTRIGADLQLELTLTEVIEPGRPPETFRLVSGVKMRNKGT